MCLAANTPTSTWSRGMIPPLGGGGPGFDSRSGPTFCGAPKIFTILSFLYTPPGNLDKLPYSLGGVCFNVDTLPL